MRVLWFSSSPSCYDTIKENGWIEALEHVFRKYLPDIELGIAFEHTDDLFKVCKNGVSYYPIKLYNSRLGLFKIVHGSPDYNYNKRLPHYKRIIADFKPDIIQCFGAEKQFYGMLAKENIGIPIVIHIMGFSNINTPLYYHVIHKSDLALYCALNLKSLIKRVIDAPNERKMLKFERENMLYNNFFMGRTQWDKDIVRFYSPESKYFYCPEAIRQEIYNSKKLWKYKKYDKLRLITVSNGGAFKGNEIMLQTAFLLKNVFKVDFEWKYTSTNESIRFYEKITGIKHTDVNIKLIGRIEAKQVAEELVNSNLYIHSSIIDNSPNALCEAQLIGIPVIANNVGGIPQLVEDKHTGFLYPYNECHALAFKILTIKDDEKLLTNISNAEISTAKQRHDPQNIANLIKSIYTTILSSTN